MFWSINEALNFLVNHGGPFKFLSTQIGYIQSKKHIKWQCCQHKSEEKKNPTVLGMNHFDVSFRIGMGQQFVGFSYCQIITLFNVGFLHTQN